MKNKYCKKGAVYCKPVKACENCSGQIVRTVIPKCSEKKLIVNFQGNTHDGDHSYPDVQLAALNFTEGKFHQQYFSATYLKLLTNFILPVGQLGSLNLSCHVHCVAIPRQ